MQEDGLDPVANPGGPDVRGLVRITAYAALAIVGRLSFVWAPNIALTYVIVFLAGVTEGALAGALVGLLAMTATNLLFSGLHPVLVANGLAMALVGLAGGALRPMLLSRPRDRLDNALRVATLAAVGLFSTFLFSVATDLVGWTIQFAVTPEGQTVGRRALGPLLLAGLAFNLVPAIVNMLLFPAVTPPVVEALERAGLRRTRPIVRNARGDAT